MSAWDAIQTRDVDSIVAEVFEQMTGRSDSDPTSPWADLALALCQRIKATEGRSPPPTAPEQQAKIEALAKALEAFAALHGDCRCDECAAANKALRLAGRQ